MSIVFKPKITKYLDLKSSIKPKLSRKPKRWSPNEISQLIEMKAIRVPTRECGAYFKVGDAAILSTIGRLELPPLIRDKRRELIRGIKHE
jgi:hypothetical protein